MQSAMTNFEISKERFARASKLSLVEFLRKEGYSLSDTGSYFSCLSPFRNEGVPSLFISKKTGKWRDYGNGKKGDIIDLVQEYKHLGKKDAVDFLLGGERLELPIYEPVKRDRKSIEIVSKSGINSPYLVDYLTERRITLTLAQKYLVELEIKFPYGKYPERISKVLGFKNDASGYEMRNKLLKLCNSPKTVTTIIGATHECINVYEGFFSFLSDCELRGSPDQPCDAVILNSLSFLPQMLSFWGKKYFLYCHLDNDKAGDKAMKMIEQSGCPFHDMRTVYEGYNDLNDLICGKPIPKKKHGFIHELINS
jgi:hypothetical protein